LNELQAILNKVLEDTLEELSKFQSDTPAEATKQSKLALDLINITLSCADLNAKSATLCVKLYELAKQHLTSEMQSYVKNTFNYLKSKESNLARELLKKLSS